MMENINTDALIPLVEVMPVLWDKSLQIYKNKQLTMTAWREIFCKLNPNFGDMQQIERQEFGRVVVKRWTHIRDSWMKSFKRQMNKQKSGSLKKSSRPYIYHKQMSFLKKVIDIGTGHNCLNKLRKTKKLTATNEVELPAQQFLQPNQPQPVDKMLKLEAYADESNFEDSTQHSLPPPPSIYTDEIGKLDMDQLEPNLEITSQFSLQPPIKGLKADHMDSSMVQFLYTRLQSDDSNRHLSFFRGILPSLDSFSDEDTLEFQAGMLALIQKIKKKHQRQSYSMCDSMYRPGFSTQQSIDSLPSTSGYFTQQNQSLDAGVPSAGSVSSGGSSTEFNFEDADL